MRDSYFSFVNKFICIILSVFSIPHKSKIILFVFLCLTYSTEYDNVSTEHTAPDLTPLTLTIVDSVCSRGAEEGGPQAPGPEQQSFSTCQALRKFSLRHQQRPGGRGAPRATSTLPPLHLKGSSELCLVCLEWFILVSFTGMRVRG